MPGLSAVVLGASFVLGGGSLIEGGKARMEYIESFILYSERYCETQEAIKHGCEMTFVSGLLISEVGRHLDYDGLEREAATVELSLSGNGQLMRYQIQESSSEDFAANLDRAINESDFTYPLKYAASYVKKGVSNITLEIGYSQQLQARPTR